jgi:hypothetical protein
MLSPTDIIDVFLINPTQILPSPSHAPRTNSVVNVTSMLINTDGRKLGSGD